jgi:DNA-binding phage protein
MYRAGAYDEMISKKMQNKRYAQGYLMTLMEGEDGLSVEESLKQTIRRMGVTEFSQAAKVPRPNVQEFLKGKRKLKNETLNIYLKPFGLKIKITVEKAA